MEHQNHTTLARTVNSILQDSPKRLVAELHAQFADSAKLEQAINANLPALRSTQRVGGRGLGYGG